MARQTKLEKELEKEFMEDLNERMPGGFWLKGNSAMRQGVPDRMFLHSGHFAALEFKRDEKAEHQPSQDYYVDLLNEIGFARIVTPDNYHEVLDEIQSAFGVRG